jgi:hypothetical protein
VRRLWAAWIASRRFPFQLENKCLPLRGGPPDFVVQRFDSDHMTAAVKTAFGTGDRPAQALGRLLQLLGLFGLLDLQANILLASEIVVVFRYPRGQATAMAASSPAPFAIPPLLRAVFRVPDWGISASG